MTEQKTYITIGEALRQYKTSDKTIRRNIERGNIESKKVKEEGRDVTKVLVDDLKKHFQPLNIETKVEDKKKIQNNTEDKNRIEELEQEVKKNDKEQISFLKERINYFEKENNHLTEALTNQQKLQLLTTQKLAETEEELKHLKMLEFKEDEIEIETEQIPEPKEEDPKRKGFFRRIFGYRKR